jgi:hypothetical protein
LAISTKDKDVTERGKPSADKRSGEGVSRPRPGVADYLAGEAGSFKSNLSPYLPQELIGGAVPHIPGAEEEAVWNAASQACGTEKVNYVYSADGGRLWYLACPSSALASAPDSWCPLAAALPGKSEFWDKETVYLYEQEGVASALRWDPDTGRMQVFLGAARTLLPRMQSMDANFVTINPELADIVPWRNRTLRTEKLSRAAAMALLYVGIGISLVIFLFLIFQFILTNTLIRDLDEAKEETQRASQQLMVNAYNALQSDSIKHMVRIQELLDELEKIDGTLVKYNVDKGKVTWEVLVSPAFGPSMADPKYQGTIKGQVMPGFEPDGRVRIKGTN